MTTEAHPNIAVLQRLDLSRLGEDADLFAGEFVWHFFNPRLPDLAGDYAGVDGLQTFFEKLGAATGGTFRVEPLSVIPIGDEFLVVHARDTLTLEGQSIELDAVVVWRIVAGQIAEAWDIPGIHTIRPAAP